MNTSAPKLIIINAFPGTGKLTIGRMLKKRINARLLDNHTILNPAETLFERSDPLWKSLYETTRNSIFDHLSRSDSSISLICTDILADIPEDRTWFEDYRNLSIKLRYELVYVLLTCSDEENARRLVSPDRAMLHKLSRTSVLESIRKQYTLLRPEGVQIIELDVSRLSPDEAASIIEGWLK